MPPVILYLPDAESRALAAERLAGRSLAFRAVAAAARSGAALIGVPIALRTPALDRALEQAPGLGGRVRWLAPGARARDGFTGTPCLLVPVPALVAPGALRALLAGAPPHPSGGGGALPVLVAAPAVVTALWDRLAAGEPVGRDVARHAAGPGALAAGAHPVRSRRDRRAAEAELYGALGTRTDSPLDRLFHRRGSRWLTRLLVSTPATPNQVSLLSLLVGGAAIWACWNATPLSAALGVLLYAAACVVDHADGEVARLTFQESRLGASLDWAVDTVIHAGLVLAMGVTAGGQLLAGVGAAGAVGIAASALCARGLHREAARGAPEQGALHAAANRDFFYLLLLAFAGLRWLAPGALPALVWLAAAGAHAYWIACLGHLRAFPRAPSA